MNKGDILLIRSKLDPIGWIIRKLTNGNFNHACIVLNSRLLIDIRTKRIEIVSIEKYTDNKRYICEIKKLTNLQEDEIDDIIKYILNQKRNHSYISWLISVILLFKGEKPIRPTCSGLIAEAFYQIGYYFRLDKEPYQITPQDISNRKYL